MERIKNQQTVPIVYIAIAAALLIARIVAEVLG